MDNFENRQRGKKRKGITGEGRSILPFLPSFDSPVPSKLLDQSVSQKISPSQRFRRLSINSFFFKKKKSTERKIKRWTERGRGRGREQNQTSEILPSQTSRRSAEPVPAESAKHDSKMEKQKVRSVKDAKWSQRQLEPCETEKRICDEGVWS
jgi:hypothetical protein